jgi:hypothetical protein
MSKKPSRKKAPPAKRRRMTFTITVEAQRVAVRYRPYAFGELGEFEFRSPHKPPRRIPMSETGFRSHFVSMRAVKRAKSVADFARDEALALLPWRRSAKPPDSPPLPLFS